VPKIRLLELKALLFLVTPGRMPFTRLSIHLDLLVVIKISLKEPCLSTLVTLPSKNVLKKLPMLNIILNTSDGKKSNKVT
jgi:hypothetical protein